MVFAVSPIVNEQIDSPVNNTNRPLWKNWPFRIVFAVLLASFVFCVIRVKQLEAQHPGALKNTAEARIGIHQ